MSKTVITLTAIYDLLYDFCSVRRVLVIAPLRVAAVTWRSEVEKWEHLKGLSYAVCVGTQREREAALNANARVTFINRENVPWLIRNHLWVWDMVVIDELSSFKSHSSQRFRALLKVRPQVKRIVGLTGTPAPNSLLDLWAEFRLLDLGERLGRFITRYRLEYFTPDKVNGPIVYSYRLRPGAEKAIYSKISDMTVSMKAVDHLNMPELITTTYAVEMSEDERRQYQELKKNLVLEMGSTEITASSAATLTQKLSQMANGAIYDETHAVHEFHQRKLDALEDIIESANGNPLLIAYWFKHDLARIQARFPRARELKSAQDMADWNAGRIAVALIHPASAGHGLNLQQGGNRLVWFGLTWSLELYQQTNGRLWRQGQQHSSVVLIHIVTKGSVDERVLRVLAKKDSSQSALIDAVKAELSH